jgi:repressor LexA
MARPFSFDLTQTQRRVALLLGELERQEQPAFVSTLVDRLQLAGESSLTPTLLKMERNGYVQMLFAGRNGRSRVIKLTAKGRLALGIGGLPLFGYIPAGPLSEAIPQAEEMIEMNQLLPHRADDFLLRVRGDSMIGDGIFDGDLVLLRPEVEVPHGAIAAACVGEDREGTLKRVYYEGAQIRLKAANPQYADILVPAEQVTLAGLLQGVIRHVRQ